MPTPGEQARIPLTWQSERLGRPYDTQPRLDAGAIIGALGLDVSITQLGEAFTIDESLTDALRPAQSHVHRIGLPETDADIAAASERGKIRTIEDYGKSHRQLDTGRVLRLPDGLSRMAASERRTLMRRAESIARVQTENTIRERAREMRRSTELGLRRSTALTPLTSALRMAYGKELDSTPLERVEGMPEADMLLVVSPDELAAGVSEKLFRGRMRERGIVDLSKEALDARSDNLLKVLQIELGSLFLHDTVQLGTLGRAREDRALGLFRRYKDVLGEDDLDLKVEAYDRLAEGASKFSSASDQPGIGEFASLLATRAYNTLSDVHMLKYELGVIYDGLGYPVPAVLRDDKPSIHDMAPQLQPSTQAEAPPVPETDPAATAEAQRLADTLGEPVQAFNDLWRLSAKSRTKRELDTVVQALCKGTVDATGNQALTAMERGYAREVTDILARLHEYSSGKRSIADRLTEADATQQTLTEQLRFVRQFAIDNHVRSGDVQYPVLLQLHSHLATFRNNWSAWRQLITDTWPANRGEVATAIEQALFPERAQATPPIHVSEQRLTAAAAKQLLTQQRVTQLDQLILPPKPTVAQIRDELRRVQAPRAWDSRVAWDRLYDLLQIRDDFEGELFQAKKDALGKAALYFIVEFGFEGDTFAVAESPAPDTATFIVNQRLVAQTWIDIFKHYRRDVVKYGATKITHAPNAPYGEKHVAKIHNKILELALEP